MEQSYSEEVRHTWQRLWFEAAALSGELLRDDTLGGLRAAVLPAVILSRLISFTIPAPPAGPHMGTRMKDFSADKVLA